MAGGPARKGLDGDKFSIQVTYFIDSSIVYLNLNSKKLPSLFLFRFDWTLAIRETEKQKGPPNLSPDAYLLSFDNGIF